MRCLLDKNVVRLVVVGLYLGRRQLLSPPVLNALVFWQIAENQGVTLCITEASANVLKQRQQYAAVRFVLATATELHPGRYCRRWARRLGETTGLAYEDAMVVALGTFGTDPSGAVLGAHAVVTYDRPLINGYDMHLPALRRRLQAMTAQLSPPFNRVVLPLVVSPDRFLDTLG